MLDVSIRDIKKKGKTLRNKGIITGTLKRKDGRVFNVEMIGSYVDTLVARKGLNINLEIKLQGELIISKIDRVQRDLLLHNIINIDLLEI